MALFLNPIGALANLSTGGLIARQAAQQANRFGLASGLSYASNVFQKNPMAAYVNIMAAVLDSDGHKVGKSAADVTNSIMEDYRVDKATQHQKSSTHTQSSNATSTTEAIDVAFVEVK